MGDRKPAKTDRFLPRQREGAALPGIRDVIGAWLLCLIAAAGSLAMLALAAPPGSGGAAALIGKGGAATVAVAEIDHATRHRERRC